MEQYWMPRQLDFEHLRKCLDNYKAEYLFIRLIAARSSTNVKVDESLESKTLDFKKNKKGLSFFIDGKKVFHFTLNVYNKEIEEGSSKGFSLAYERYRKDGRMIHLPTGEDPYDLSLPEPKTSMLRHDIDNHLVEISFQGRIPLEFHSWWKKPHWKYWTIEI